jgi:hypothetical protein
MDGIMIDLNNIKYKRIFCFGCSFTAGLGTWADLLKLHFENTDTEVRNFGWGGAGNYYIFNNIVEKSLLYDFTKDDLILIQWSGCLREDRFKDGEWWTPGNILNQDTYSKSFVDEWFFDEEGMTKRDYSYIHSIQKILECTNVDYEMFSMNGLKPIGQYRTVTTDGLELNLERPVFTELTTLYHDTLIKLHPSMFKIIWGSETAHPPVNNIKTKISKENPDGYDQHPLPSQHLLYLEKVFQFKPSDEFRTYVDKITKELLC